MHPTDGHATDRDALDPEPPLAPKTWPRWAVAAALAVGLAVGGGIGYLANDDDANDDDADPAASVRIGDDGTIATGGDVDLGLQASLAVYLDALVSHDWPRAHAFMCADLAEQISPGSLKQELAGSEENAGPLVGYEVSKEVVDETGRTADVEYALQFEEGSIDITARFEREGSQWRVCSFANQGGTGAFSTSTTATG